VYSSVSGSYLFNSSSIGEALMNLTQRNIQSQYRVRDFMRTRDEAPLVQLEQISLESVLRTIETGGLGFCLVEDQAENFVGLISMADIRKGMLQHLNDFNQIDPVKLINQQPVVVQDEDSVKDMLSLVRRQSFPISYLPVVNHARKARGIVTFVNLIKGEL
jgi:ribulose-phosphate 3-epimerase